MSDWKPKPVRGLVLTRLPLSMEAGFVMSRLDGATRASELGLLTGLPADRIDEALRQLLQHGALDPEGAPAELLPPSEATPEREPIPEPEGPGPVEPVGEPGPPSQPASLEETEASAEPEPPSVPETPDEAAQPDDTPDSELERSDYQALYQQRFAEKGATERAAEARQAKGSALNALCLDPLPEVIRGVLENSNTGPTQARLIARHHHTAVGLNFLLGRAEYCRDDQVRRLLLRNPQLAEPMLARLYAGRRLKEIYAAAQSHEITDQSRRSARNLLRQRFASAASEEKVEVIWKTEGRVLAQLIGVGLDGKSAQMLCERPYASLLLVQNLAKWPPTPQPVLRHLLNQALVKRQPGIRALIKRHPNAPKDS